MSTGKPDDTETVTSGLGSGHRKSTARQLADALLHCTYGSGRRSALALLTPLPIGRGFLYLVAILNWASRAVLSWRLSNTMDVSFCVSALEEALARFGKPEIFNTDQGSQFTSTAFTGVLLGAGVRISMDGRGRWMDNVFIERLWRSLKYEEVYLKHYADGREARAGIGAWVAFYNRASQHPSVYVIEEKRLC
jgi:putative transposase